MLYVILANGKEMPWHTSDPAIKNRRDFTFKISEVEEVQADGDELQAIVMRTTNLPEHNNARVQHWFGDHAKWIVANVILNHKG